jgi:D-galactarolactone isomerase
MPSGMQSAAPHSSGHSAPAIDMPSGSCDCHMHLFDSRFPFAGPNALKHGDASVAEYQGLQQRLGLERCVIVQPSGYGIDHRVLVSGLEALGNAARGIAVVTPQVTADELAKLSAQGVVGARMNLVQRGVTDASMIEAIASRIQPFGWHLQVHLLPQDLIGLADRLVRLPVPVVIDHYARVHTDSTIAAELRRALDRLIGTGRVWLKLSAPYIASPGPAPHSELAPFVHDVLDRFPDRLVWGSDWPHVTEVEKPDDAQLLDAWSQWIGRIEDCHRILVANPRALYGF